MKKIFYFFALILVIASLSEIQAGPMGKYYLVAWQNQGIRVFQGNTVESWATAGSSELGIAVNGTVKTVAYYYDNTYGAEYSLWGNPTGTTYPVYPNYGFHDGTTDGTYNYAVSWHTQKVFRFNSDWSNPQELFSIGFGLGNMLGITYDPTDNTMWLLGHSNYNILHVTMTGSLIGSFTTNEFYGGALALDYMDDTLWFYAYNAYQLQQYSKSGVLLQTVDTSIRQMWGGEFDFANAVPEAGTFSTIFLSLLVCFFLRKNG